jgi:hypothetical protein
MIPYRGNAKISGAAAQHIKVKKLLSKSSPHYNNTQTHLLDFTLTYFLLTSTTKNSNLPLSNLIKPQTTLTTFPTMYSTISVAVAALFLASAANSAPAAASSYPVVVAPSSSSSAWEATATSSIAAASSSTTVSSCPTSNPNAALYASLVLAPNAVARQALLTDDQFVFDFTDPCLTTTDQGVVSGDGGKTVRADHLTFPALTSNGGSITMGFLGPCGFNTPHVHPRAAEMNIVVEGRLFASVTAENGARHMNHTLKKFEMTVFPAGAIHTEFNPDCTPATFVAAFPNEDVRSDFYSKLLFLCIMAPEPGAVSRAASVCSFGCCS